MFLLSFAVDIISAIEFDKTGDHLATGDRGGRVVLFERTDSKEVTIKLTRKHSILCIFYYQFPDIFVFKNLFAARSQS